MMDVNHEGFAPKISVHGRICELPDLWEQTDDWTGVTSTAERKRRQNRLNQRAYRRRRKINGSVECQALGRPIGSTSIPDSPSSMCTTASSSPVEDVGYDMSGCLLLPAPHRASRTRELIQRVYQERMLNAPRPESLQVLIRLNLLNALASNAKKMGFPVEGLCKDEYISPFNALGPHMPGSSSAVAPSCPDKLHPTSLQREFRHHPWLDLFPFPSFRDNIFLGMDAGLLDDDELCFDVLEIWSPDLEARPSILIWGDAWDPNAWEVSPAFVRKWGWLLKDCPEIFESTNHWRQRRGVFERVAFPEGNMAEGSDRRFEIGA